MPEGVAQLEAMGVDTTSRERRLFSGVRYVDDELEAEGTFEGRSGLGMRRPVLHQALVQRAAALGADLRWGVAVVGLTASGAATADGEVTGRWVVGADGRGSRVRRWAGLDWRPGRAGRHGVRRHYRMEPWTDRVEVHWGPGCEGYVTPVAGDLVGLALMWSGQAPGFDAVLGRLPRLAARVAGAEPASRDAGAGPFGARARTPARGRVLLVGDAACCLDPITGEGIALALQSAEALVAAVVAADPGRYGAAHRRLVSAPARLNRLVLLLERLPALRRRVIRVLAARPPLFDGFLAVRRGSVTSAGAALWGLSWRLLSAGR